MDFEEYEGSFGNLIIYAKITGYILFASLSITYNTVVSWDLVRILLIIVTLLDIIIKSVVIHNNFLTAQNMKTGNIIEGK